MDGMLPLGFGPVQLGGPRGLCRRWRRVDCGALRPLAYLDGRANKTAGGNWARVRSSTRAAQGYAL